MLTFILKVLLSQQPSQYISLREYNEYRASMSEKPVNEAFTNHQWLAWSRFMQAHCTLGEKG